MARHTLTNIIKAGGLAVAVAAASGGVAHAFTETKVTPPAAQAVTGMQSAPAAQQPQQQLQLQKSEDGKGLTLTTPGDGNSGTEIKIPGVGSVGSLPKLDFGLELLYGGNNAPANEAPLENGKDDVQIKGSIKHRF